MFELIDETEDPTGTTWTVQRIDPEGRLQRSEVRLSWADYDVWTPDGTLPPSRVAEAVVAFVLARPEFDPLPEHYSQELKQLVAAMLQRDATKRPGLPEITVYADQCRAKFRDAC